VHRPRAVWNREQLENLLGRDPLLWLGAGASRQAEPPLPMLTELVARLQAKFGWTAGTVADEYGVFDAFLEQGIGTDGELSAFLEEMLRLGGRSPQPGALHRALARIAKGRRLVSIIDTNYDLVLRSALEGVGASFTPCVLDRNLDLAGDAPRYISLHGSRDD
jgi:hypothetical protein